MKIKICGLTRIEDIEIVNEANPDFIGFIFVPESKRAITPNQAIKMKTLLNKNIKSVGVFANTDIEKIQEIADLKVIDLIQLHGTENNTYIELLKRKTDLPIIKAFKADEDLKDKIELTNADYVLIDSYNQNSFGGTGKTFDWGLIPETKKQIFLAGGLNSDNIKKAIAQVKPYCTDINSGVETNGKKDRKKILDIIQIIKGYENE